MNTETFSKPAPGDALSLFGTILACAFIYWWYFVAPFLSGYIVMGGDTQLHWSLNYLSMLSLKAHGEFLWWDPTTVNGWPAYVNETVGWFNYLGPYSLPAIALFKITSLFSDVSINTFLVLQKTLYYFTLNLLAIMLIAREVIVSRIARFLPALVFTLSAIQFHGFRDSVLYESLPAPLFFVWAVVLYHQRRTQGSLLTLGVFAGLYIANLNYGALQTSLWWTGAFLVFLVLASPDLPSNVLAGIRAAWRAPRQRTAMVLTAVLASTAVLAFVLPVFLNLREILRVEGVGPVNYSVGTSGGIGATSDHTPSSTFYALSHPVWTVLFYWVPFESIHDALLFFDDKGGGQKAGIAHRYIGLVTIPMLLAAATVGIKNRMGLVFVLTAFACSAFVTYTNRNLLIINITNLNEALKNIRTISDTLPRDAPIIFLALTAGIGFDALLATDARHASGDSGLRRILKWLLGGACLAAFATVVLAFAVGGTRPPAPLAEALAHIGIYMFLFSILTLSLASLGPSPARNFVAVAILCVAFMDLTISATGYWQLGRVWFKNEGAHTLPHATKIVPIESGVQNWVGSAAGFIHNPFAGPFMGLRSWLVLSSRPEWQGILENYDAETRIMKKYPDFRFFRDANYIPFERVRSIDTLPKPAGKPVFYIHDTTAGNQTTAAPTPMDAQWEVLEFSPNHLKVRVNMPADGYMLFLDNFARFWQADVDTKRAKIYRANFTFKSLHLSKGEHVVEWSYDPYPVKIAWAGFYVALFLFLGWLAGLGLWSATGIASILVLLGYLVTGLPGVAPKADKVSFSGGKLQCVEGKLALKAPDGHIAQVQPGPVGSVEWLVYDKQSGVTGLSGWAIDGLATKPAKKIVVTWGDLVWVEGTTSSDRKDIAGMDPAYLKSGFTIAGRGIRESEMDRTRAFVVLEDGSARELDYRQYSPRDPLRCALPQK